MSAKQNHINLLGRKRKKMESHCLFDGITVEEDLKKQILAVFGKKGEAESKIAEFVLSSGICVWENEKLSRDALFQERRKDIAERAKGYPMRLSEALVGYMRELAASPDKSPGLGRLIAAKLKDMYGIDWNRAACGEANPFAGGTFNEENFLLCTVRPDPRRENGKILYFKGEAVAESLCDGHFMARSQEKHRVTEYIAAGEEKTVKNPDGTVETLQEFVKWQFSTQGEQERI